MMILKSLCFVGMISQVLASKKPGFDETSTCTSQVRQYALRPLRGGSIDDRLASITGCGSRRRLIGHGQKSGTWFPAENDEYGCAYRAKNKDGLMVPAFFDRLKCGQINGSDELVYYQNIVDSWYDKRRRRNDWTPMRIGGFSQNYYGVSRECTVNGRRKWLSAVAFDDPEDTFFHVGVQDELVLGLDNPKEDVWWEEYWVDHCTECDEAVESFFDGHGVPKNCWPTKSAKRGRRYVAFYLTKFEPEKAFGQTLRGVRKSQHKPQQSIFDISDDTYWHLVSFLLLFVLPVLSLLCFLASR